MDNFYEVLRMEQIVTESLGNRILNSAKLNLFRGEIAGLIGLNYSGKTTLVGGITGHFPYTSGMTLLENKHVTITSIEQARKLGIFYVQPQSSLISDLTIAENIFLTPESGRGFLIRRKRINQKTRELLDAIGLCLSEESSINSLTFFQQVMVEVCKAVLNNAKIIIFDNIVSILSKFELGQLQQLTSILRTYEIGILIVEARIQLLTALCDRMFILRDGRTVGILQRQEYNIDKIVSLMIGYALGNAEAAPEPDCASGDLLLELRDIDCAQALKSFSLSIYRNEVLGMLNVDKYSGIALEKLLSGQISPQRGQILMENKSIELKGPHDATNHGIVLLPENDEMIDSFSVADNILLTAFRTTSTAGMLLNQSELRYLENELIGEYCNAGENWVNGDDALPDGWLFRKKIAFCRGLASSPKLMVFINPTQRIDFYSRKEIYEDILSLKKQRVTALIISVNIDELVSICDRVAVVQNGKLLDTFAVTEEQKGLIRIRHGNFLKDI